jgi:hypothetical protein
MSAIVVALGLAGCEPLPPGEGGSVGEHSLPPHVPSNDGLACAYVGPEACGGSSLCCVPAGVENEACINNRCSAGLACITDEAEACGDSQCCVLAGGANQPCAADADECSGDLACVSVETQIDLRRFPVLFAYRWSWRGLFRGHL